MPPKTSVIGSDVGDLPRISCRDDRVSVTRANTPWIRHMLGYVLNETEFRSRSSVEKDRLSEDHPSVNGDYFVSTREKLTVGTALSRTLGSLTAIVTGVSHKMNNGRRKTLAGLSPAQINSRASLGPARVGKDGKAVVKSSALSGRPSLAGPRSAVNNIPTARVVPSTGAQRR